MADIEFTLDGEGETLTVVNLIGVIEDGGPSAPGIPVNTRQAITLYRGSDHDVRILVRYRSGPLFIPLVTDSVVMTFRKEIGGAAKAFVAAVSPVRGYWLVSLAASDLKSLDPSGVGGRWIYDVVLIRVDGREMLIPISYAEVVATVSVLP